jgi:acyl homoserine lactone synthase
MLATAARPLRGSITPIELQGIEHLRYQAFRERLNWEVQVMEKRERDQYDDLHPVYVMVREAQQILACARLLPSTGPYMLKDVFPQLLSGQQAPVADDVWEISRFAVTKFARPGFGFSALPTSLMRAGTRFALLNNIREYVFVTTVAFERLLVRMGVHLERFGPPQQVGIEKSVALRVFMDEQTISATRADCEIDPFIATPSRHVLVGRDIATTTYQYC